MNQPKPLYPESRIIRRLGMWAPDPSSPGERANLNWAMKGSNLELVVWTRSPAEKVKAPIKANLNTLQAQVLCDMIKNVCATPGKNFDDIPLKNMRRTNKEDPDSFKELYDQAVIRVAKTSEGMVQIGVFDSDESRPRIFFPFILDRWTGNLKRNGQDMTLDEVSQMVALQYSRILSEILNREIEMTTNAENAERYPNDKNKPQGQFKKPFTPRVENKAPPNFDDLAY